jgi:hypothetical protein
MSQTTIVERELHEKVADVLAEVYRRVDWRKMTSMKRTAVDQFADRVRVASQERSFTRAVDRMCRQLGLSSVGAAPEDLMDLNDNNDEVMDLMRTDAVFLALLAQDKARRTKV